ncbi:DUF2075 domain-containing protein [Umezawaea beigongshangensis]|uniref:DUF2075 domain-containing protein n=1 Tax=Umezawaea beigongshangensis TaxID=2780383 RepID=UPI0018F23447|nr:DUF2075 domain-containing protein [Umezawaea beigongshangensis]
MSLLRASARSIADRSRSDRLVADLARQFEFVHRRSPSQSERNSWRASLTQLTDDLLDGGLGEVELLVEYQLPLTSKRADVVLAGTHPDTGLPSYVVVELKQWTSAHPATTDPANGSGVTGSDVPGGGRPVLFTVPGLRGRHLHPAEQVAAYCAYIRDFVTDAADDALIGVAYLHNAQDQQVPALLAHDHDARLFTATSRGALLQLLRARLSPAGAAAAADRFLGAEIGPSKQLLAVAARELADRDQFVLLDEQRVAFHEVLEAVRRARRSDLKEVLVVLGGPGSGKSAIALALLGELAAAGRTALHATGSKSFTTTLRKTAGRRNSRVQALFKYFNNFTQAERNGVDVLICDEAHRVRETSNNRYTPAARRSTQPQIAELIDAARTPVFLLDEKQVVRPGEMGSRAEITAAAQAKGLPVRVVELDGQFRCGGSRRYEDWVLRLLGLHEQPPFTWTGDDRFEVRVADTPAELEKHLAGKLDEGFSARMTAGFCWKWSDPTPERELLDDVVIGDWARPWNVKGDRGVGHAPPSQLWATDPAGFGQIGCIYTAQGFEYDWNGVILGPDLVWRGDRWASARAASKDTVVARAQPEDFHRLVRHTYKVLLTRGMKGTVLYSTDPETRAKLHEMVGLHLSARTDGNGPASL